MSLAASKPIQKVSSELDSALQQKINSKTKPLGSLGAIETLALQIGRIQNRLDPELRRPHLVLFAADHGATAEGISAYSKDVTWQMVKNILSGGAASSVLARQFGVTLSLVDAGVDHDFFTAPCEAPQTIEANSANAANAANTADAATHEFIDAKIARGTHNFIVEPAMTAAQCNAAISRGGEVVQTISAGGCNVISFGEMGIGNTSAAALLMHALSDVPLHECIGRGAGLDDTGLLHKRALLDKAWQRAFTGYPHSPTSALTEFGGFEITMMVGAMLTAARLGLVILVDGFIVSAALLVASRMEPNILDYCVFAHQSDESGHRRLLEAMGGKPLLTLGLRLGEGTGALMAYPLLQAAVTFLNNMASFESAGVSTLSAKPENEFAK